MTTTETASSSPIITIDGPTASGKGTVARAVADALGFHLLDSGAIYRAHALACLNRQIDINNINALEEQARVLSLKFYNDKVWVDKQDATADIRAETVGMAASAISAIPQVRAALLTRQRDFAQAPGLVADGRDMGTIVFPEARLKVFLTASVAARASRRARQVAKQLIEKGNSNTIESLLETVRTDVETQIRARDAQDKNRAIAPLRPAADAVVIDNAGHGPNDTINAVLALWSLRNPAA